MHLLVALGVSGELVANLATISLVVAEALLRGSGAARL